MADKHSTYTREIYSLVKQQLLPRNLTSLSQPVSHNLGGFVYAVIAEKIILDSHNLS